MPLTGPKFQAILALLARAPSAAADLAYLNRRYTAVAFRSDKPGKGVIRIAGAADVPAPRLAVSLAYGLFNQRYYDGLDAANKDRDRRDEYIDKMKTLLAEVRWHEAMVALELWRVAEPHLRTSLLECVPLRMLFRVGLGLPSGKEPSDAQLARLGDPAALRPKWAAAFIAPAIAKYEPIYGNTWDEAHPAGSPVLKPAALKLRSLAQREGVPSDLDEGQHPSHARLKQLVAEFTSLASLDDTVLDELANHLSLAELLVPSTQPAGASRTASEGERWSFNVLASGRDLWLPTFTDLPALLACQPNWIAQPYVAMRGSDIARMIVADGKALWTLNPTADRPGLVLSHVFSGRVVTRLAAELP